MEGGAWDFAEAKQAGANIDAETSAGDTPLSLSAGHVRRREGRVRTDREALSRWRLNNSCDQWERKRGEDDGGHREGAEMIGVLR